MKARTTSSQIFIEEMKPTKTNAPTVEPERPQGEWIPVEERLPEMGESVLVCIKTQGGISQYVSERFHDNQWSALGGRTPIAWRPLPEPYEKGGAE